MSLPAAPMSASGARLAAPVRVWAVVRLTAAALILAAVATQLAVTISVALNATTPHGSHVPTVIANFFSFFTILSNLSAIAALAIGGVWLLRSQGVVPEPRGLALLLACSSTYMIVTGIVYNVLLRGIELPQGTTVGWANEVLHVVGPLVLLADALVSRGRRRLGGGTLVAIAAFPVLWAGYTLLRANAIVAPMTGAPYWYPYPFLDPHLVAGGYLGVAGYIVSIAIAILVVGAGVVGLSRWRGTAGSVPAEGASRRR